MNKRGNVVRKGKGKREGKANVKVKVKLKVMFTLEQATKTQRGLEVQLYSFFNFGARWGGWSTPRPGRFTTGKDPVPIA